MMGRDALPHADTGAAHVQRGDDGLSHPVLGDVHLYHGILLPLLVVQGLVRTWVRAPLTRGLVLCMDARAHDSALFPKRFARSTSSGLLGYGRISQSRLFLASRGW